MIRDNNKFMFQLQNKQTTDFQVNENTLFALHIAYFIFSFSKWLKLNFRKNIFLIEMWSSSMKNLKESRQRNNEVYNKYM